MEIHFGPNGFVTPEQAAEIQHQREEQMRRMVDEKRCIICKNTFLVNDQITFCSYSKNCVDNSNGQNCQHWESLI